MTQLRVILGEINPTMDGSLVLKGDERAWAVTVHDDRYRYVLGRQWDLSLPFWTYGMLNPSKARHVLDDPTIRKCRGFAERGGAGGFVVGNLLAFSSFDPDEVVAASQAGVDVRGELNTRALEWILSLPAARRIAAWGRVPKKLLDVARPAMATIARVAPDCFGLNQDGSPRHPLMLAYATPIVKFGGGA